MLRIDGVRIQPTFSIHLLVYAKKRTKVGWLDHLSYFMLLARGSDSDGFGRDNEEGVYLVPNFER